MYDNHPLGTESPETAKQLVDMFKKNFKRFEDHVDADVKAAEPTMSIAA